MLASASLGYRQVRGRWSESGRRASRFSNGTEGTCSPLSPPTASLLRARRSAVALLDKGGRVLALLAGSPRDSAWPSVAKQASDLLEEARQRCTFAKAQRFHRRGEFCVLARGVSFGGGQKVGPHALCRCVSLADALQRPGTICNSVRNAKVLRGLCEASPISRIAGWGSSEWRLAIARPSSFLRLL